MLKALDRSQQDKAQDAGPHIVQPKLVVRASSAPPGAEHGAKGGRRYLTNVPAEKFNSND
jgi:hypothetical protein